MGVSSSNKVVGASTFLAFNEGDGDCIGGEFSCLYELSRIIELHGESEYQLEDISLFRVMSPLVSLYAFSR